MVTLSKHAYKRVKERLGIPKKAAVRQAELALTRGVPRRKLNGSIRKYVDSLWHKYGRHQQLIVYNNRVFVFDGEVLVTVVPLPTVYAKYFRT